MNLEKESSQNKPTNMKQEIQFSTFRNMVDQSKLINLYKNVESGPSNACIVFLSILLGLLWIKYSQRKKGSAPGPFLKIPFLGHLESLLGGSDLVKKSAHLRKKYGDMFSYNIIGMNAFVFL